MRHHKKQHFVSKCYLRAWADPDTPRGQTPFVWIFQKDGRDARKKAPDGIFHETDMYTIEGPDGLRNLVLEQGLSQLESMFARLRRDKLSLHQPLFPEEHVALCAFVAATQARTPKHREHWRDQWSRPLKMMDQLAERHKTAIEANRRAAVGTNPLSSTQSDGFTHAHVQALAEKPTQNMLVPLISTLTPLLARLDACFLETDDHLGFITSDNPCTWFDPEAYKRPPRDRAPALMYDTIEITMPISPTQCLYLNQKGKTGYKDAGSRVLDELNRRTRFQASEHFVARRNETRPIWFDPGIEPGDSWENTHGRSA